MIYSSFILLGNLSFDCSEENIRNHFNMAGNVFKISVYQLRSNVSHVWNAAKNGHAHYK